MLHKPGVVGLVQGLHLYGGLLEVVRYGVDGVGHVVHPGVFGRFAGHKQYVFERVAAALYGAGLLRYLLLGEGDAPYLVFAVEAAVDAVVGAEGRHQSGLPVRYADRGGFAEAPHSG